MSKPKNSGIPSDPGEPAKTGYGSLFATNLEEEIAALNAAASRPAGSRNPAGAGSSKSTAAKTGFAAAKANPLFAIWAAASVAVFFALIGTVLLFNHLRSPQTPAQENNRVKSEERRSATTRRKHPAPFAKRPETAPRPEQRPNRKRRKRSFQGDQLKVD